jgi:hypothetical protein
MDPPSRRHFAIPTNGEVGASRVRGKSSNLLPRLGQIKRPLKRPDLAGEEPCTYLCGNSLGLLPKPAEALVQEEFRVWGSRQAS